MKLIEKLADHALKTHPAESTTLLEGMGEDETVRLLDTCSLETATGIIERLSPQRAASVVGALDPARAVRLVDTLPVDIATRITRRLGADAREQVLGSLGDRRSRSIRSVLQFPEGSAGALMDPDVLALPRGLRAREALQRVRKSPELSRYNLYVVDQTQRLVGVLNLRELLIARGRVPLEDLMVRDPHRVVATDDRASVLAHPGWKEVHSLPVVDHADVFVGAIRYRVLRQLEDELLAPQNTDLDSGAAFGEVILAGARGLLAAIAGGSEPDTGRGRGGANESS